MSAPVPGKECAWRTCCVRQNPVKSQRRLWPEKSHALASFVPLGSIIFGDPNNYLSHLGWKWIKRKRPHERVIRVEILNTQQMHCWQSGTVRYSDYYAREGPWQQKCPYNTAIPHGCAWYCSSHLIHTQLKRWLIPLLQPYAVLIIVPHKLMSIWVMSLEHRMWRGRLAVKRGQGVERGREKTAAERKQAAGRLHFSHKNN